MARMKLYYEDNYYYRPHYGFFHFMWDLFMILITGGLWIIWIFIREMRNR